MWVPVVVAEQLIGVLDAREAELRVEQAVHGLDVESETGLQALLADGLRAVHEVARELHYPSAEGKLSHRPRCDLVLSARGEVRRPEAALWLELKVAQQLRAGGHPNPRYAAQWRRAIVADLKKMRSDPSIRHAAIAFVVFTDGMGTLAKDLGLFEAILAEEALLAGFRAVRSIPLTDRIGHTLLSVAVWPVT